MSYPDILFHDNTLDYTFPLQPAKGGRVTLMLRAMEGDVTEATLCLNGFHYTMSLYERREGYDFFRIRVRLSDDRAQYYFHVVCRDGEHYNYDRRGAYRPGGEVQDRMQFRLIPGFTTPSWAKGAVYYQILVDRFCNGDAANDVLDGEYYYYGRPVRKAADWNERPSSDSDFRTFYGGDLQGVINKLDYLKELGIDAIYLNPIFVSPSSHKYDTQDYDHVDPHLGRIVVDHGELPEESNAQATRYVCRTTHPDNLTASDKLFIRLVREAHKRDIRVILDGVFNHCGSFHRWLDKEGIYAHATGEANGAYHEESSPYRRYFAFTEDAWPSNDSYEGWWGYETLPKLNYEGSEALCEEILRIAQKWVSAPFYADGWRLDVAADLGHSHEFNLRFWKRFRDAVKAANPEAVIIAEHYGPSRSWLDAGVWDSVMNYDGFMEPVSFFLTGMEKHSDEYLPRLEGDADCFLHTMRMVAAENFTAPAYYVALNQLSNHDHSRFLTRTNRVTGRASRFTKDMASEGIRPEVYRQAALMLFTWPGSPALYYGDEAGVTGFTDPDNRRTYPWGHEDQEMIAYHKELIRLRHSCPELRFGSVRAVAAEKGLLAYGRFTKKIAALIVINLNGYAVTKDFDLRRLGIPFTCTMQRLLISTADGFRTDELDRHVKDGVLTLLAPPTSAILVRYDQYQPISKEEFWKRNFIRFGN